jgi:PAS domain S-box-containing protein
LQVLYDRAQRWFAGVCALVSLGGLVVVGVTPALSPAARHLSVGALLLMAGAFALCAVLRTARVRHAALLASMVATIVVLGAMAYATREGVHLSGLWFSTLAVIATAVLLSQRAAFAIAALAAAMVAVLAWVVPGLPDAVRYPAEASTPSLVATELLGLGAALAFAWALRSLLDQNESRMLAMLRIAARAHWELDAEQRLVHVLAPDLPALEGLSAWHGLHWSQLPGLQIGSNDAAALRERLDARQGFVDLIVRLQTDKGRVLDISFSGEPRFDRRGKLEGFWGVARDVSAETRLMRARQASEARYRELFTRSPMPLVLHRAGLIIDANPAAVALFGHDGAAQMHGLDIFAAHYVDVDGSIALGRERSRLLLRSPPGTALPPAHFHIRTARGAKRSVRATGTRIELKDGPAIISFYFDDTEIERTQLELQAIVQRALVGIAYTRNREIVRVNDRFAQMFDWKVSDLVGQPGAVVWPSQAAYEDAQRQYGDMVARGVDIGFECEMARRDGTTLRCWLMAQALDADDPASGTIWIAEDVTERRRSEAQLAAARDAAEAASRAKSAFLANMSHEIRTPLNGLMGLARLAQRADLPRERQQDYLRQIMDSAESLSQVLSDTLDLSKIEAGRLSLEAVPFSLRELLQTLRSAYESLAQARGLMFDLHIDEQLPHWLLGDPVRLRQIITNFLTNALKFTQQGRVRLYAAYGESGWLRVEVEDTGMGIDAPTRARLFRPFTQADESTTRRFGGTGLGLSICRELASLMGGQVSVSSALGRGSCFSVQVPLPVAAAPVTVPAALPVDDTPLRGLHVLVAEDNPVNMLIAVATLEQWGARVAQAHDGRDALDQVVRAARRGEPFDVIVMDVQMPKLSGHEATRALRQRYGSEELAIIGLTAAALVEERNAALAAGMDAFLTKPIELDRLRDALLQVRARRIAPAQR